MCVLLFTASRAQPAGDISSYWVCSGTWSVFRPQTQTTSTDFGRICYRDTDKRREIWRIVHPEQPEIRYTAAMSAMEQHCAHKWHDYCRQRIAECGVADTKTRAEREHVPRILQWRRRELVLLRLDRVGDGRSSSGRYLCLKYIFTTSCHQLRLCENLSGMSPILKIDVGKFFC